MKKLKGRMQHGAIFALGILAAFAGFFALHALAFSEPSGTPPSGSPTSAPLNAGTGAQIKGTGSGTAWITADGFAAVDGALFDGRVGIDNDSPSQALDVDGYVNAQDGFCINHTCLSTWPAGSQWTTNGTIVSYTGGSVGIGTANPAQKLQVAGNVEATGFCITTSCITTWPASQWTTSGSSIYYAGSGAIFVGNPLGPDLSMQYVTSSFPNPVGSYLMSNGPSSTYEPLFLKGSAITLNANGGNISLAGANTNITTSLYVDDGLITPSSSFFSAYPAATNWIINDTGAKQAALEVAQVSGTLPLLVLAGGTTPVQFNSSTGATVGSITTTGSATAFNTTSDRRLKEDIATSTEGLDALMQVSVDNFAFINDPSHTMQQGFIAQQLDTVYPEAVTTNGDNGLVPLTASSTPWEVDYGRLTPLLASSIQNLNEVFDATNASTTAPSIQSFYQGSTTPLTISSNGDVDAAENINAGGLCLDGVCIQSWSDLLQSVGQVPVVVQNILSRLDGDEVKIQSMQTQLTAQQAEIEAIQAKLQ